MKQAPVTAIWISAAFCTALGLAAAALAMFGIGTIGLVRALQVTTRFSFLLFWLAYAGGALKTLFGPAYQNIAWRGRDFGLAFVAAHLVPVGLVAWFYQIAAFPLTSPGLVWFFAAGLAASYALVLLSIERVAHALGHLRWRIMRVTVMEFISLAFLIEFLSHPLGASIQGFLLYVPFATLSILGTFMRLAAWASRGVAVTKHV